MARKPVRQPFCGVCRGKRKATKNGKWRCPKCDKRRKQLAPKIPRETAVCKCGKKFQRSTQSKAIATRCPSCRNEAVSSPTPEDIRAATQELQRGWTLAERRRRAGVFYVAVETEVVDSDCLLPGGFLERDTINF